MKQGRTWGTPHLASWHLLEARAPDLSQEYSSSLPHSEKEEGQPSHPTSFIPDCGPNSSRFTFWEEIEIIRQLFEYLRAHQMYPEGEGPGSKGSGREGLSEVMSKTYQVVRQSEQQECWGNSQGSMCNGPEVGANS